MKQQKRFFLIGISVFAFLLGSTSLASAQGFSYTPLENIPGAEGAATFPQYVSGIYKFALWAVGIAAMFMLTIGGFMYMTSAGNTAALGRAKEVIKDSIIGLVLALFAWLILNIINPDLVKVNLEKFSQVGGTVPPATPQVKAVLDGTNALPIWAASCTKATVEQVNKTVACMNRSLKNSNNANTYGSITSSSKQNVLDSAGNLDGSGFDLSSSGNCWDSTCTNCTSLHQIPKYAVQYLKELKTKSGCGQTFVITGGTEYGHTTHCPNAPSIDIRNTDAGGTCLGNYLKSILTGVGNDKKKYEEKLQKELHIDTICADAAWNSVAVDCGNYQEPNGHFHINFCGYVDADGSVDCS